MRVLVTGCNGQVGRCLVNQLANKAELLAVDRSELDITHRDAVFDLVNEFQPDYVINAAAHTAVDKAEQEPDLCYAVNRDGPQFLAQAAKSIDATILHISTDYVFSGNKSKPYEEGDETGPLGVYGDTKLAGELALAKANEKHIVLRTAWVFGEHGNNFVKTMLRVGASRDSLTIVGDQVGGPTYAGDIAAALIRIIEVIEQKGEVDWGVYHFSGAPHVSWYEFAREIFKGAEAANVLTAPQLTPIPTSAYPTPAKRPINSRLDCSKISANFGIAPSNWTRALKNIQEYKS
ncbi:dTDP-4-dehydrorhamnose reductase [Vibrio ulleungensis]|uniref:dTDP-4-dehydrorhamnose reductase n=1 Tax=Vibrio ulleungensis TaxID=2807619 RepID=A0ABS2HNB5_9VIBR|nr:dTDP-4-dehydrorhamnose reductase [Vibrio ulleungensis]MBM7037703.1 dTDP-4-dehydrorhamnose reductase [Vibrio ulleungensis]